MAPGGVSLRGELRYRDGEKKSVEVKIDGGLASMIAGVKTLQERVSELLTELAVREKQEKQEKQESQGGRDQLGSDDEDDEDEDDSDEDMTAVSEPPSKKPKAVKK